MVMNLREYSTKNDWLYAMIWTDKACVGSLLSAHNGYSMPVKTNIRSLRVSLRCLGHIKYNVHILVHVGAASHKKVPFSGKDLMNGHVPSYIDKACVGSLLSAHNGYSKQ